MSYLVLAYPEISEKDFAFIQSHRKAHDPKYFSLVGPHFTLVFASSHFSERAFIDEVVAQTKDVSTFEFVIRCATLSEDDSGDFYHVFLVPDEGYSNIIPSLTNHPTLLTDPLIANQ